MRFLNLCEYKRLQASVVLGLTQAAHVLHRQASLWRTVGHLNSLGTRCPELPARNWIVAAIASIAAGWAAEALADSNSLQWPSWGGGILNQSYALNEQSISSANVAKLKPLWIYTTEGSVNATPTIDGDYLYANDWKGFTYKIARARGAEVWKHQVSEYTGKKSSWSRNSPAIGDSALVFGDATSSTVVAIDKNTAKLLWKADLGAFGTGGIMTGSPVIYNNVVYVGVSSLNEGTVLFHAQKGPSFRGSVAAIDLTSGSILWQTPTVPDGYTGGAVWSSTPVVDAARGLIYASIGDNYSVPTDVATCINATTDQAQKDACMAPNNGSDAVMAFDLHTGQIKWVHRTLVDVWNALCGIPKRDPNKVSKSKFCPVKGNNMDLDFGAGPNMINANLVGAGQKSGAYYAFNPDNGNTVWSAAPGPSGIDGGIEWGTATDGRRVYVAEANFSRVQFKLAPDYKTTWDAGSWAAIDVATGQILWQTPTPTASGKRSHAINTGSVSVANGVVFGGTMEGDFVALNAQTGAILWTYASGGSVADSPSIVGGVVYWGSGYPRGGKANNKLYAFTIP
jgi:polyvinyl alcohol dehydrogenase (cytochrome)